MDDEVRTQGKAYIKSSNGGRREKNEKRGHKQRTVMQEQKGRRSKEKKNGRIIKMEREKKEE